MITVNDLRQGMIDYVASIDKSKLSISELSTLAVTINAIGGYSPFFSNCFVPFGENKEAENDG